MAKIFISYRRDDTLSITDRLANDLSKHFDSKNVFRDLTHIGGGEDFTHAIENALEESQILLVIIGKQWVQILNERTKNKDEVDWVRFEVETGIRREERNKMHVIPVLVENAPPSMLGSLPDSLTKLRTMNAMSIRYGNDYDNDVARLISTIQEKVNKTPDSRFSLKLGSLSIDWRFWVPSIVLPLIAIILALIPILQSEQNGSSGLPQLDATLYYGESDGLTFIANSDISINNFSLVTNKNRNLPAILADDFASYLTGNVLPAGSCIHYQRANTEPILPRVCNRASVTGFVVTANPFWYDDSTQQMLNIDVIHNNATVVKTCLPVDGKCDINN